jgi:hypothetical protein
METIFWWSGTGRSAKLLFGKSLAEKEAEMWNKIFGSKEIDYLDDEKETYPAELEEAEKDRQLDR